MKVSILCTDPTHPVNTWLERWAQCNQERAEIVICRDKCELVGGDMLFLVSCHQIIGKADRDRFRHTLVIHASDLPRSRGWSPLVWSILNDERTVTVSLLDAEDELDSGDIWQQRKIVFDGTELFDEINSKLFEAEISLLDWAIENEGTVTPMPQVGEATYLPRRNPSASEVDTDASIAECFDLLRVADPDRYPAFFRMRGQKYRIRLEKMR